MPATTVIGEYLRARRELVQPEDVGLPNLGRRRTPGLRREEVAMLAGVSADYYIRLEQGRDHHPSSQVLDALARVLQLDEDATAHLHGLVQPPTPGRRRSGRPERPPEQIIQLMMSWPTTPAYIIGRYLDVLAANPMASAPQVGRLELSYTKFPIPETDRQTLSVYYAAPGSPSERALAVLATTTVREREPERTLRD
jgi:transcriptional regulator with XRE-family HTH domain